MNHVKLIAPAKVNLVLAVGEKLPDGYHEVHTIIHALALHDTIEIRRTDLSGTDAGLSIHVACQTLEGVDELDIAPEDNIVYRAAMRLAEALGRAESEHIDISIEKRIPHQAGLGGGSSNAAATIKGLAQLWNIASDDPRLVEVAASLGADVPFFLFGGCAYLDGKGDQFAHSLEPRKGFVTLVRPEGAGVPTAEAYATFDQDPAYPTPDQLALFASYDKASEVRPWNNLTAAAVALKPELNDVFSLLNDAPQATSCVLSGSGSVVAALCESYEDASALSMRARKAGFYSRVTSFAPLGAEVLNR